MQIDFENEIKIIEQEDDRFPKKLLELPNCPKRIFVLGNDNILNDISVAIVGTRAASNYGKNIARELAYNLSKSNIIIVSGMADGIDENAHIGTFDMGTTIAIVAGGFKEILRGQKLNRAIQILSHNGTIISEYPPDFLVNRALFLQRNRLIAAMSICTIVVEAPLVSGSLNTAMHAKNLNKTIFAVPWNLDYYKGKGCSQLLLEGAIPLIDYKQVLNKLQNLNIQISLDDYMQIKESHINIPPEYSKYYEFIKLHSPSSLESILENFSEDFIGNIVSSLTMMEIKNYIKLSDRGYIIT